MGGSSDCPRRSGARFCGFQLYRPSGTDARTDFAQYPRDAGNRDAASRIDDPANHPGDNAPEYAATGYDQSEFDSPGNDASADDYACESERDYSEYNYSEQQSGTAGDHSRNGAGEHASTAREHDDPSTSGEYDYAPADSTAA